MVSFPHIFKIPLRSAITGGTICAERTAIVKAVVSPPHDPCFDPHPTSLAERGKAKFCWTSCCDVSAYPISHIPDFLCFRDVPSPIPPCGMCRQVIREFCSLDMPILLVPSDYPQPADKDKESPPGIGEGGVRETTLGELLPFSFGPEDLELPRN